MYRKTFIIGLLTVFAAIALAGYNLFSAAELDTVKEHNENGVFQKHLISMGLLIVGGILISISKAQKSAAEKGENGIDHFLDQLGTPASKVKNINISGNNNQVDSNKRNINTGLNTSKYQQMSVLSHTEYSNFKDLIIQNKFEECFESMTTVFMANNDKDALNMIINLNSQYRANQDKYNSNLINVTTSNREKSRITNALLELIDQKIEKNS